MKNTMARTNATTRSPFLEYARFGIAGLLNTATDFVVLNGLLTLTEFNGTKAGLYIACKAVSFSVAVAQSYYVNKNWVFNATKAAALKDRAQEGGRFFAVSLAGFFLNILGSSAVFAILGAANLFDPRLRANAGALAGTAIVLGWNYIGYKFFVFKNV